MKFLYRLPFFKKPTRFMGLMVLLFSFVPFTLAQRTHQLENIKLVDVENEKIIDPAIVVWKNQTLIYAGPPKVFEEVTEADKVNGQGKYVTPALVDAHIHYFQSGGLYTRPDVINLSAQKPYAEEMKDIKNGLADVQTRYINSGVAAVVDCGGPFWNFEVRANANNNPNAPYVAVAGPLISTYQPPNLDKTDPPIIKVNNPEEAIAMVKKQAAYKPDFIKIWYIVLPGETAEQHLPIIEAVIDESTKHNLPVMVHATQLKTAKLAVKAGAKVLVHSVFDEEVDKEFVKLLKKNEVIYIPTLAVHEGYNETFSQQVKFTEGEYRLANPNIHSSLFELKSAPDSLINERVRKSMNAKVAPKPSEIGMKNLKILSDAGIIIATGTDAGNIGTPHGPGISREMQIMEEALQNKWKVLRYSTLNGNFLFKNTELGSWNPGAAASFILSDNPLEDIQNLFRASLIVHKGSFHSPERELHLQKPEIVVQQQVNAYNARNIEQFLSYFSDTCNIYDMITGELLMKGKANMKKRYGEMFKNLTSLHCTIENRITIGNKVIDRERVTGMKPGEVVHAVAIYEVYQGKIVNCWFIKG